MATKRKASRKGKKLHGKAQDPVQVAAILAFAAKENVVAACKRFGVADRTVRRYKARVESGNWPEVAELIERMTRESFSKVADLLAEAWAINLRRNIELVPKMTVSESIKSLETIGQILITKDAVSEPDGGDSSG